jgi:hypothetical protein
MKGGPFSPSNQENNPSRCHPKIPKATSCKDIGPCIGYSRSLGPFVVEDLIYDGHFLVLW